VRHYQPPTRRQWDKALSGLKVHDFAPRDRRGHTARTYERIREAHDEHGTPIPDLARAYGIPYSRAWAIVRGKITVPRPYVRAGAAAGAWKNYGPTCKRGHPRPGPEVRDRRARRCKPCERIRAREYYKARHARPLSSVAELYARSNRMSFETWWTKLRKLEFRARIFVRMTEVRRRRDACA